MNNASIHHMDRTIERIHIIDALVRFLPPYSPDLNPIEEVFSKVKSFLRANDTVIIYILSSNTRFNNI